MIINNNFHPSLRKVVDRSNNVSTDKTKNLKNTNFDDILKDKVAQRREVRFSKHAQMRLESRNIDLREAQRERISNAVQKAEEKGVKDSLVIVDDMALVVNVGSKTVITIVKNDELMENVFTNIDGAVFT
ncbi:MAG: flagellar biosynthesis protein [Clostridium sp.]|nr:flagellar biosynthesis protein [Clostridium sp.]